LKKTWAGFKSKLEEQDKGLEKKINQKISSLDFQMKDLKAQVALLKEQSQGKAKGSNVEVEKLKKIIEEQSEKIAKLEAQFNSLESVLKSLNQFLQTGQSLKSTGPTPNPVAKPTASPTPIAPCGTSSEFSLKISLDC
jgi:chromosome segregation ATPase